MHTEYRIVMATLIGFTTLAVLSVINPTVDLIITIGGTVALVISLIAEIVHCRHMGRINQDRVVHAHPAPMELVRRR